MSDMGIGGYASLMRTQKNPYERNIATTNSILSTMPKDGGVTGLEGIGKIPLMYQQGVDTANAQQFDEQRAAAEDQQLQGVMKYQQAKDFQTRKDNAFKNYLELAKQDPQAANQFATSDPIAAQTIPKGMVLKDKMDKNGWLNFDSLNDDGTVKTNYHLNIGGLGPAADALKAKGILNPTVDQIAEAMPSGFALRTSGAATPAKDVADPKLTGHLVKDPTSDTGYSYAGDDGKIMTRNAPTPSELHPRAPKSGDGADSKDFRAWTTKLDGLRKSEASILKGVDPFTGMAIPPENTNRALATIRQTINETEGYIAAEHPERWSRYKKSPVTVETIPSHGATTQSNQTPPMSATNPSTGQRIVSYDGGKSWQAAR